jgi:glycosyltransferase involved in cell wall biosynthesis
VTVSIITPTFERPVLLMNRCIPSIMAQSDPEWELHVIGDGTDAETVQYMTYLAEHDSRVRFTNLPHVGGEWGTIGLAALNHGLDTAKGEWISVLADDDWYAPDHNEVLVREAEARGVDFMYGVSESPRGQRWGAWPPGDGQIANGAYVYRGKARDYRYDLNCIRDRGLNGDADLWTRMYAGGVTFALTERVVHRYYPSAERV